MLVMSSQVVPSGYCPWTRTGRVRLIRSWRRRYDTGESRIAALLEEAVERWPGVLVGSYPSFQPGSATVEVVLKSRDDEALGAASAWLDPRIAEIII